MAWKKNTYRQQLVVSQSLYFWNCAPPTFLYPPPSPALSSCGCFLFPHPHPLFSSTMLTMIFKQHLAVTFCLKGIFCRGHSTKLRSQFPKRPFSFNYIQRHHSFTPTAHLWVLHFIRGSFIFGSFFSQMEWARDWIQAIDFSFYMMPYICPHVLLHQQLIRWPCRDKVLHFIYQWNQSMKMQVLWCNPPLCVYNTV